MIHYPPIPFAISVILTVLGVVSAIWINFANFLAPYLYKTVRLQQKNATLRSSTLEPEAGDELLQKSASELRNLLKNGSITSRELVEAYIKRALYTHPHINALVHTRFDEALQEADEADKRFSAFRRTPGSAEDGLPPLLGIPCSVKENFTVTGCPNTSGLLARKDVLCEADAPVVQRLRAAGAIILGVTNVSELCMWMETYNYVYGLTRNPYDKRRIVGGSSGGEAALVGAGAVPFGVGSDVGGSIRLPAFFNGVFAHKPSPGLIPNTGQHPPADTLVGNKILSTGPICRYAEDLPLLIEVLRGPDGCDPACQPSHPLPDPKSVSLRGMRFLCVGSCHHPLVTPVSQEMSDALSRAAHHLVALGMTPIRAPTALAKARHALEVWASCMETHFPTPFSQYLYECDEASVPSRWALLKELYRSVRGESPFTIPAVLLAVLEGITKLQPEQTKEFVKMADDVRAEVEELLADGGVLLFPPYPRPAPYHFTPYFTPFDFVYTAFWNAVRLPVTQVPLGLSRQGLPLGVQVIGRHGYDHETLAVALALEKSFGGWVPPPLLQN